MQDKKRSRPGPKSAGSKAKIHPLAVVEDGAAIGKGSRVWAFAHVLPGAVIGEECNLCDHTFVEGKVRIGNRVTVKSGVYLWDGVVIEDDVFIGPCVAFTNDKFPQEQALSETLSGNHCRARAPALARMRRFCPACGLERRPWWVPGPW
jgi:UDP-3-O-[3-hydroxymyristoyl] glucosamine N-acyltransferase